MDAETPAPPAVPVSPLPSDRVPHPRGARPSELPIGVEGRALVPEVLLPLPPPRKERLCIRHPAAVAADLALLTPTSAFERDYDLGDEIGRGTSSTVYRARHRVTHAEAAVKVIDLTRAGGRLGAVPSTSLREVHILRELDHPGIIRVLDAYEGDTVLFIAMEFAPYGELYDALECAGTLTEVQTRHVMWQALDAVIHRGARAGNAASGKVGRSDAAMRDAKDGTAMCCVPR